MTPQDEIALIPCTQASAKLGLASGEIQNPNIKIEYEKITKIAHLFLGSDMAWIQYFYSQLFNPEIEQEKPNIELDKIRFAPELIQEIESTLESIKYEGFDIIKDGLVNWEVLSILREKFNNGKNFNELEAIITGFAILHKEGVYIEGKVNSASDFNENSFEKTEENQESLSLIQKFKLNIKRSIAVIVRGFSMSGIFEDGDVVGAKKVTRFSRYKKGDIIVFTNKDGERVIHMVVGTKCVNGKTQFITWGVNNPDVDRDTVARKDIVGKVVMSAKEQYNILAQVEQGKVLIIDANGMVNIKEDITAKYEMHDKLLEYIRNYPGPQYSKYYKNFLKTVANEFKRGKYSPIDSLVDHYKKQQPLHPDFNENDIIKIAKRKVIMDKSGKIETLYTPLEMGNDEFGLIHLLIGHWKNQFQRWQMDVFELVDTIMNTINTKVGRLRSDGAIIYEMGFSDIYGKAQYLAVIFGDYNNIITAWRISEYEDADKLFTTTNFIGEV